MSLATVLKVCKFIKKRLNTCVFLLIFQSFRDSFFYRTTPVAAFEVSFSQRKEFQKKKNSGETAFGFHQLVLYTNTKACKQVAAFAFLEKFAEFYYHKIFETRSR